MLYVFLPSHPEAAGITAASLDLARRSVPGPAGAARTVSPRHGASPRVHHRLSPSPEPLAAPREPCAVGHGVFASLGGRRLDHARSLDGGRPRPHHGDV